VAKASDGIVRLPTRRARVNLAKRLGGIPRSQPPVAQSHSKAGSWWEYKTEAGERRIIVAHKDGTVHIGTPKAQSEHLTGGPPKYHDDVIPGGLGHIGELYIP